MRIDLQEMERRLGRPIPSHYKTFVGGRSLEQLESTLAAPAEIAALNLEQRTYGNGGPTSFGFALYESDGDCLLLRDKDESGLIYEWSHETREIRPKEFFALQLLDELSACLIGTIDAGDPTVMISRAVP